MANIEDEGRGYGVAIALQHLMHLLVRKGVISQAELLAVHDGAQAEISRLGLDHVMSRDAAGNAARTVGLLVTPPASRG